MTNIGSKLTCSYEVRLAEVLDCLLIEDVLQVFQSQGELQNGSIDVLTLCEICISCRSSEGSAPQRGDGCRGC